MMRGCVCPHPPLLIPEIGGVNRVEVTQTIDAMERLAADAGVADLIVIVSPHTPGFSDTVAVRSPAKLWGDFRAFRCPHVGLQIDNDVEFVDLLVDRAGGGPLDVEPVDNDELDHGVLVPLSFLRARSLVSLSIVRSYDAHVELGSLVRRCADELGRTVLFVASGDLSHRLKPGAPAGYDPRGAEFDERVVELLTRGDLGALHTLEPKLVAAAGECGLRSFIALGAFLGDEAIAARMLSYEGPFGVGYAVAAFDAAA